MSSIPFALVGESSLQQLDRGLWVLRHRSPQGAFAKGIQQTRFQLLPCTRNNSKGFRSNSKQHKRCIQGAYILITKIRSPPGNLISFLHSNPSHVPRLGSPSSGLLFLASLCHYQVGSNCASSDIPSPGPKLGPTCKKVNELRRSKGPALPRLQFWDCACATGGCPKVLSLGLPARSVRRRTGGRRERFRLPPSPWPHRPRASSRSSRVRRSSALRWRSWLPSGPRAAWLGPEPASRSACRAVVWSPCWLASCPPPSLPPAWPASRAGRWASATSA